MLVNIHQAKTTLSQLIKLVVEQNEEVIIGKMGKPVAKLTPYRLPQKLNKGKLKGKIIIKPDFDRSTPEIEKMFYE